ncbi:MAG: LPS export ABC transporter permease LptG [Oligoflexia bacterium]|nr:LPS export ABC transporter permease LptG [Oligoflexia bacterium]
MLSIIDRYISKEFLKYFAAALIVFSTLFLVVDMLSTVWQLKGDSTTIWRYYLYNLPMIIYRMTPVSCLMATIFTISVMSRNNELVALFSSGLSLARAAAPILVMTLLIAIGSFFVSDKLIPSFTKLRNYIYFVEIKKQPWFYYTVKVNKIWYRSKDLIYNIKTLNPEKNLVQGLTIYYFNPDWQLTQVIVAAEGHFQGSNWILQNGSVTLFLDDSSFPLTQTFKEKTITLDEKPTDIQGIDANSDLMTVGELRRYIKKNKDAALDTTRYEVAYHGKFAFAFVSFVMAFLGIPFSVSKDKSGSFALSIGLCFGFVFMYWTLVSIGLSLGRNGTVNAFLAAWTPNAVMLSMAVFFLLRLKK